MTVTCFAQLFYVNVEQRQAKWSTLKMDKSEAGKKGYAKTQHQLNAYRDEKRRTAREMYELDPKFCPACETHIPYEKRYNKFCNQSCAASYNNRGVVRVETTNPEDCAHCGAIKETRQNKYCDACIADSVYNIPQSLSEINSQEGIRSYLLRTRDKKCEICGVKTWLDKPAPLEAHHVDGNPDNNVEENLQLLCRNCHAYAHKYGNQVKLKSGRFSKRRKKRRKRYSEGKSW